MEKLKKLLGIPLEDNSKDFLLEFILEDIGGVNMFNLSELVFLKDMLGIKDNDKDIILQFVLGDIKQIIKDYCHIKEVPEELNNTVLRMAIDLYRNKNLGEEDSSLGSISSITEGDTSISYRSSATEFKDSLLNDYKAQLNRYRKLVW